MAARQTKQTLITPDGRKYTAQSEREATHLVRTAGYRAEKASKPAPAAEAKTDDSK